MYVVRCVLGLAGEMGLDWTLEFQSTYGIPYRSWLAVVQEAACITGRGIL